MALLQTPKKPIMKSNQFIKITLEVFNMLKMLNETHQKVYATEVRNLSLRSDLPSKSPSIISKPARRSDKENS